MRTLGMAETDPTRLAVMVCHGRPWRAWPEHDALAGRSGVQGWFLTIMSSHKHPHRLRRSERGSGKEENEGGELATVDRGGSDAPVSSGGKRVDNTSLPLRD
jgi:hypothetical protein